MDDGNLFASKNHKTVNRQIKSVSGVDVDSMAEECDSEREKQNIIWGSLTINSNGFHD